MVDVLHTHLVWLVESHGVVTLINELRVLEYLNIHVLAELLLAGSSELLDELANILHVRLRQMIVKAA